MEHEEDKDAQQRSPKGGPWQEELVEALDLVLMGAAKDDAELSIVTNNLVSDVLAFTQIRYSVSHFPNSSYINAFPHLLFIDLSIYRVLQETPLHAVKGK